VAVVVDADLLTVLATRDERRDVARALVERWLARGVDLHAPELVRYEMASALTLLVRAGRLHQGDLGEAAAQLASLPVRLHRLDDIPATVEIALTLERQSAYDAAYVALATALGAELWTLDRKLARNAGGRGFPVHLAAEDST